MRLPGQGPLSLRSWWSHTRTDSLLRPKLLDGADVFIDFVTGDEQKKAARGAWRLRFRRRTCVLRDPGLRLGEFEGDVAFLPVAAATWRCTSEYDQRLGAVQDLGNDLQTERAANSDLPHCHG